MVESDQWNTLRELIDEIDIQDSPDSLSWSLNSSKKFTTKSLYEAITFRGVKDTPMQKIWKCPAPMKMKHFVWLARKDRIQSAEQLRKKGWGGSEFCQLCVALETTDHMPFACPMAVFTWCICRDALGWGVIPKSFDEFFMLCSSAPSSCSGVLSALLVAVCWSLWITRNNMIFRSKLLHSLLTLPFQISSFLLQWEALYHAKEVEELKKLVEKLKSTTLTIRDQRAGVG